MLPDFTGIVISFRKFGEIMRKFFNRLATVSLMMPAWSIPAFCGEIHGAAAAGDLAKIKALLKDNPELASDRDDNGMTMELHLCI
jgi:hypothetical protein